MKGKKQKNYSKIILNALEYRVSGNKMKGASSVFGLVTSGEKESHFIIKIYDKDKGAQRFEEEIKFLKNCKSKRIVKIVKDGYIDYSDNEQSCKFRYYIMKKHVAFSEKLKKTTDPILKLRLFLQLCYALRDIHALNIIHRDIKPDNILYDTDSKRVLLCDFGIAKFPNITLTQSGDRLANANYCAPEQRQRDAIIDKGTDIYAMGLILNEMFTGEIPSGSHFRKVFEIIPCFVEIDRIVSTMTRANLSFREKNINVVIEEIKQFIERFSNYKNRAQRQLLMGVQQTQQNKMIVKQFINDYYALVQLHTSGVDVNSLNLYYHNNIHCQISTASVQGELVLAMINRLVNDKFTYESNSRVVEMKDDGWGLCSKESFKKMIELLEPYAYLKSPLYSRNLHVFGCLRDYHAEEVLDALHTRISDFLKDISDAPIFYLYKTVIEYIPDATIGLFGIHFSPVLKKSSVECTENTIISVDYKLHQRKVRAEECFKHSTIIYDDQQRSIIFDHISDYHLFLSMCKAYSSHLSEESVLQIDIEDMINSVIPVGKKNKLLLDSYSEQLLDRIIIENKDIIYTSNDHRTII